MCYSLACRFTPWAASKLLYMLLLWFQVGLTRCLTTWYFVLLLDWLPNMVWSSIRRMKTKRLAFFEGHLPKENTKDSTGILHNDSNSCINICCTVASSTYPLYCRSNLKILATENFLILPFWWCCVLVDLSFQYDLMASIGDQGFIIRCSWIVW